MTLEQMLAWNGRIPLPEYEVLLKKIASKKKAIRKAQEDVYSEEDSLEILADEKGSDRWQRHETARLAAVNRVNKLNQEIIALERGLVAKANQ